ncbi:hypothetical protein [Streptomyces sp. BE230]|uniref:hypothetical protein n=1 Tax=Streptomyces sp. BE230 TaxID=3002526 RepID=UPI002ED22969|nr:hypothetical protein [Streptomyces sp. BE230]
MAARKEEPPQATVRPQEYAAGTGWEIGQTAPEDAYRALGGDGHAAPVGPVLATHPGGHARLIVVKGAVVTEGARRELDAAEQDGEG